MRYTKKDLKIGDVWISLTDTDSGRKKDSKITITEIYDRVAYIWKNSRKTSSLNDFLTECRPLLIEYPIY